MCQEKINIGRLIVEAVRGLISVQVRSRWSLRFKDECPPNLFMLVATFRQLKLHETQDGCNKRSTSPTTTAPELPSAVTDLSDRLLSQTAALATVKRVNLLPRLD